MNKHQKLVQKQFLNNEEAVIKSLKQVYGKSLEDVTKQSEKLQKEFEELSAIYDTVEDETEREILKSRMRSKVYQKKYQDSLKTQISGILDNMHENSYKTVSDYLELCYEDGFIGTMFDLQGQGIPMCMPLDQKAMVRAVQTDSKISKGLYNHLGEDVGTLKKHITSEISRGISTGMTTNQIARNLAAKMTGNYKNAGGSLAYAQRIARTEGHRIQCQGTMDAMHGAKEMGADVVKQWDASLDARTRDSHAKVDGEIRELDKKFSNGLMFPGDPSGRAAEVVNCRCALLQRARWALDDDELETLKDRASYYGLDKSEQFADYKQKYLKAASDGGFVASASKVLTKTVKSNTIEEETIIIGRSVGAKAKNYDIELPNKEIVHLTEGTRVTNIETIAGKGRNRQIDEIDILLEQYGGTESEWQKKKGLGYVDYDGESYHAELHWYEEATVGRCKWKVKPDADGNWFIDD